MTDETTTAEQSCVAADCPNERLVMRSIFLENAHYFFAQTDGTYKWPDGALGDLLKQAKKEIEEFRGICA